MAQVGALVIDLIAETASFNANITKASNNLNRETAKMNRSLESISTGIKSIVAVGAALAGAAFVGEISRLAQAGLDYASSLGEVSQQLGVTSQDLQVYRYAATQVGVSQEEMDKGLQKLTRTLGDAQNGSKAASTVFAALGVDLRNANGNFRTTSEILPNIADAIAKIPDPARRASVEVQLFGKSGQKLDTLLSGGSEAVDQLRNAAQRLGIVLSDEQIQKADDTADKLAEVKMVLEARIAGVVADNATAILALAFSFGEASSKALGFVTALNDVVAGADKVKATKGYWAFLNTPINQLRDSGAADRRMASIMGAKPEGVNFGTSSPGSSGAGLGQFFASNGSAAKTPKATKDKIVRTWLDDFKDMQAETSRRMGNEQAMENPLDSGTSSWITKVTDESIEFQQKLDEVRKASEEDLKGMRTNWEDAANGILDSLHGMTDGLRSGDFLGALQGVVNLFLQLGSIGAFGKGIATNINSGGGKGFASGGYTGWMGTGDVAGVVHGQEYVFDAKAVRRIGIDNLEKLRSGEGFMRGGYTGGGSARAMASLDRATNLRIVPSPYFDVIVDQRASGVAAPMAMRAAQAGSGDAQTTMARRSRNRIPGR